MEERISFTTSNGQLSALHFPPPVPSKYKILCLHGFCCDSRIFRYIGTKMSEKGFDIYALDLFGHGKSEGKKGDPNFFDTLKSIDELIEAHQKGQLQEVFGTGTAATISMIQKLKYKDYVMDFDVDSFKLSTEVKNRLNAIREGKTPDTHGWMFKI